jgi:hypothetical protein
LELPANPSKGDPRQFDYNTISDVILHIRYTAREGGGLLRNGSIAHVKELIKNAQAAGSVRLFSVRNEFQTEWSKFQNKTPGNNQRFELTLNLRPEHYPFWSQGHLNNVVRVDILARSTESPVRSRECLPKCRHNRQHKERHPYKGRVVWQPATRPAYRWITC